MFSIKTKTKKYICIAFLAVVFILLSALSTRLDLWHLGAYNGVLLSFQFISCLLMVRVDYKKGFIVSAALIVLALINMGSVMLTLHIMNPLPGFCNIIIYLITLAILTRQFTKLDYNNVTDTLTELKNRRGLYQLLEEKIDENKHFSVVYIDLGNFKMINDNYGHSFGDVLLKNVSERIVKVIGKMGEVTRIGGDEFVVVVNEISDVHMITEEVVNSICEKFELNFGETKVRTYLTAYAGIANYPFDAKTPESLIKYADIAMYHGTKSKTGLVTDFTKDMEKELQRKVKLEHMIKDALKNNHFYMVYQPQYTMKDKKIRGFEALLRLETPSGELARPSDFIPIAEASDLILQIDDYVLNRTMKEFQQVVTSMSPDLIISINVSAKNIASSGFVDKITNFLKKNDYPAKNLEIEVTEYCLVHSVETTIANIKKLRAIGVQVALDDFGTGYTSLSYLAKMPVNLLKVDKTLVDDIANNQKSRDFVNAVISMGHLMGCEVVSEGVENEPQLDLLREQGCDFVQGYIWGRPLDYNIATGLL